MNMPCSDSRNDYLEEYQGERRRADTATRVACELARIIRSGGKFSACSRDTLDWIHRHDEDDLRRLKQEAEEKRTQEEKQMALAKLTVKERKLLNV
jgi:hypothetical protein